LLRSAEREERIPVAQGDYIDKQFSEMEPSRREFMKRMSLGVAAVPIVASFSLGAMAEPADSKSLS
jgi:hypothetical protein